MADHLVARWPGPSQSSRDGLAGLLAAYHLRTEAEKGEPVADVDDLPDRYRREISHPDDAFAGSVVLMALVGEAAAGCLAVTAPDDGHAEIKRLWTDPAFRGQGIATSLLRAALAEAAEQGAATVRLSVWEWRTSAIALYERFGFTVTASWDDRPHLTCMRRPL